MTMAVIIRQIYIENFRSIQKINIPAEKLSIFVGKNDSGKSNILRALNLFFNGVTNPEKSFDFDEDYNLFAPERAKTAKEIVVRLEFEIPASYHETNGSIIVWEKRWRATGLHQDRYWGIRVALNRLKREVRTQVDIPERSNAHSLLRQIEFEYVPAIKDARYFDELRGRIYSTIAEVATKTFRTSSTAFEDSIGDHLSDLTRGIGKSLGFDTRLALPRDLSHIFQRLDFLSGSKNISLDSRGDGIKTRHIPLILKFMAEKKRLLQVRGTAPYSFIWAYEEPENNLEFASAVELGVELSTFAKDGIAQILLTTHSPVFYDLGEEHPSEVSCAHVYRDTDDRGTEYSPAGCSVDEKMGTMALLAHRVKQLVQDVREQVIAKHEAETLASQNRAKILVEGERDRIFLSKCLKVFYPAASSKIDFETKNSGGGHTYVIDMLNGWRQLDVTLEILYPTSIWTWAEGRDMLEDRPRVQTYPPDMVEKILKGELLDVEIDDTYRTYVTKMFKTGTKIECARHVSTLSPDFISSEFSEVKTLLGGVIDYLFPSID